MIAFSCSRCGAKFKVKEQFAGRSSRCPACKELVVVPLPDKMEVTVTSGELEGSSSSFGRADVTGGVTLEAGGDRGERASVSDLLARQTKRKERYVIEGEIARGGMGTIARAVDCDVRREVAIKYLLNQANPRQKIRFIEEAQITGQLEHPNIVPIHELGADAQKRLFFSMKMVRGKSLSQVLGELRKDPRAAEKEYSQGRLLSVFVSVCHAIGYAHARGVIHRDLKPANIMIGDFGEVYVMDWGLAKVLGDRREELEAAATSSQEIVAVPKTRTQLDRVATSREPEADLTQDGAVLGTAMYMPPEQAAGRIHDIDKRSDVYSLGAILYELLALQPPVTTDGGYVAILVRVMEAEIIPPERRAPQRAGKIPRELSAIALKALAKRPEDRYPSVEALRRDVELFLDGRSVSAKEDTRRELFVKFVRRNKGFSAATFIALIVLASVVWFSLKVNNEARARAEEHYASLENEQNEKRERGKRSAPLFVRDALASADKAHLDYALDQVNVALDYDPELPEAHLAKGQILLARKDFGSARGELEQYAVARPDDRDAAELLRLCREGKPEDSRTASALVEVFVRQGSFGLAAMMERDKHKLYQLYRRQIMDAYKAPAQAVTFEGGKCRVNLSGNPGVKDLTPLIGIPIEELSIRSCGEVWDLRPLAHMPLTRLDIAACGQVRDLSPLKKLPLINLDVSVCGQLRDLSPLHGVPLEWLNVEQCHNVRKLAGLEGSPLKVLHARWCTNLEDLSALRGLKLTSLNLDLCSHVKDLSALHGMPLQSLSIGQSPHLHDLRQFEKMPLTSLNLQDCDKIKDFNPLHHLKLTALSVAGCKTINDLRLVQRMPLTSLNISGCSEVHDLGPLQGKKLDRLQMNFCPLVRDLKPLKGMPLQYFDVIGSDAIQDLSPLQGMPLVEVSLNPRKITAGMNVLHDVKTLRNITVGQSPQDRLSPGDFWRRFDKGEYKAEIKK